MEDKQTNTQNGEERKTKQNGAYRKTNRLTDRQNGQRGRQTDIMG